MQVETRQTRTSPLTNTNEYNNAAQPNKQTNECVVVGVVVGFVVEVVVDVVVTLKTKHANRS